MPSAPLPGARRALALLLAINLFNYIDRYVLAAVLVPIGIQFGKGKAETGLLMSVFLISYTLIAPLFGWLGDRTSRWKLIAIGVIVWSLASGATGLATTFAIMLVTRAVIGVGEAAYGPVAPSLISDMFPVERRGGVMAWFYMAIPVGSALGFAFGGMVSDWKGWEMAFFLVVPPGLVLGILCLLMHEPPRGAADAVTSHTPTLRDMSVFKKIPSFMLNTAAMTSMTFAFGGVATWMPTYLYERTAVYVFTPKSFEVLHTPKEPGVNPLPATVIDALRPLEGREFVSIEPLRSALGEVLSADDVIRLRGQIAESARDDKRSISNGTVGGIFGGIVVLAGLMATLSGGYLADRLRTRVRGAYFLVSGVGMFIGLPMFVLAVTLPVWPAWIFVFLAVFFLFFNTGPSNTALANVAPPSLRSSAFALNILIIHTLGDVISPPIVGWIDDHRSLQFGMYFLAGPMLLAGFFWLWGTRYLDRDTALAPTRIASTT